MKESAWNLDDLAFFSLWINETCLKRSSNEQSTDGQENSRRFGLYAARGATRNEQLPRSDATRKSASLA